MAIERFGANTTQNTSASATSLAVNKPVSLANGDVLVSVCGNTGLTAVVPTGFTEIGRRASSASDEVIIAYKVITDATSEPASYTWTGTAGRTSVAAFFYRGVDTVNVVDVAASTAASTNGTLNLSITTVTNNTMVLAAAVGNWATDNMVTPWGEVATLGTPGRRTGVSDTPQLFTAGSLTGTFSHPSGTALQMAGVITAFRPSSGVLGQGAASGTVTWSGSVTGDNGLSSGAAIGTVTRTGVATGSTDPGPANLVATVVSTTRIDLTWTAATGATGYDIERNGVVIVTDRVANSYSDTGLVQDTTYTYRVRTVR